MIDFSDFPECESVFRFFSEIAKIPHGSGNCGAIADYLCAFAKERELEYYRDSADNIIIKKPATAGYENAPAVILQGHSDMVAEKLPSLDIDMKSSGLELARDGDYLYAKGTTLGGDDGIAVAYILAILDAKNLCHPAIEAVITSDEEIGLIGAGALDASLLSGKYLINIDSEEEGIFTVGCAGGARVDMKASLPMNSDGRACYELTVSGLLGGHSGVEIDKGRANAVKLGAEILGALYAGGDDLRLVSFEGGKLDNAIPREFKARFTSEADLSQSFAAISNAVCERARATEPDVSASLRSCDTASASLTPCDTGRVLDSVAEIRSGVIAMSESIEGLVESSENLGVARLADGSLSLTTSVRSGKTEGKAALIGALSDIAEKFGYEFSTRGDYPAWEYKADSELRQICSDVYEKKYGKKPIIITIHAGLECGIFSNKLPGLDCISIGPDMSDIHTTEERLSISSAARVFDYLLAVLKRMK